MTSKKSDEHPEKAVERKLSAAFLIHFLKVFRGASDMVK
jgi:hypothetical protein